MFKMSFFFLAHPAHVYINIPSTSTGQVLSYQVQVLRVTSEYQSFHYMEPVIIIKRMVGECSSSVTDSKVQVQVLILKLLLKSGWTYRAE